MARTKQTQRQPGEGRVVANETFRDHTGKMALRYGTRWRWLEDTLPWPPKDYVKDPKFCFQVYLTVDLHLEDDTEDRNAKRARGTNGQAVELSRCSKLISHLVDFERSHSPDPLWEFYTIPGASIMQVIEHSRREIAHRKQLRKAGDVSIPLIPRLTAKHSDSRKTAFIFVVDNDNGWHIDDEYGFGPNNIAHQPRTDAFQIRFDPRAPASVTSVDRLWQMYDDPQEYEYKVRKEPMEFWPEQLDTEAQRVKVSSHHRGDLCLAYAHSIVQPELNQPDCGMDFGDDIEEEQVAIPDTVIKALDDEDAQSKLRRNHVSISAESNNHVKAHTSNTDGPPDIKYVIYVPCADEAAMTLKAAAVAFTASLLEHLSKEKTIHLDFYKPPDSSDASIFAAHQALDLEPGSVGYLTTMQAQRSQMRHPPAVIKPGEGQVRRLQPLNRYPHIHWNDPATCDYKPYTSFFGIIDRADFAAPTGAAPAVRLVLGGGGKYLGQGSTGRYTTMEVWRAPSMKEVVQRLAFEQAAVLRLRTEILE